VEAANQLLMERGVQDIYEEALGQESPGLINQQLSPGADLLTDILEPEVDRPAKAIRNILILDGIKIGYVLVVFCYSMKVYIENNFSVLTTYVIVYVLGILFSFLVFFLFYKGKQWGWILMFGTAVYSIAWSVPEICRLISGHASADFNFWSILALLFLVINIIVIILCLQAAIKAYYRISAKTIKITTALALVLPALMIFKRYFLD
jgi:hypothetical protein